MDDMLPENGWLLVILGSHKDRVYNHHQNGVFVGAVTDPDFDPQNVVPIELKAGGISIHHVRTLHASAPNVSTCSRRLLYCQYCAAAACPLSGIGTLDSFNASMIQGGPTIEPRLERVPVRTPQPHASRLHRAEYFSRYGGHWLC